MPRPSASLSPSLPRLAMLLAVALVLSLLIYSCRGGRGVRPEASPPPQTRPVARPAAPAAVSLAATAARGGGGWRVNWTLRNQSGATIWVPVRWGMSENSLDPLPLPFIVPPEDLMLVYGFFQPNTKGRGTQILEGSAEVRFTAVPDGGSFSGTAELASPYKPENVLASPFNREDNGVVSKEVAALTGVQVVVQYRLHDPDGGNRALNAEGLRSDPALRRAVAEATIAGEDPPFNSGSADAAMVLSDRVPLDLPLAERRRVNLFYEN